MMTDIGIYQILCTENGKSYVGATSHLSTRKRQHFSDLRLNKHGNPRLQADYNLLGDKFNFIVLEYLFDKSMLLRREQDWIDWIKPEYNAELKAGYSIIHVHDPEVRAKISRTVTELWKNPTYKANFVSKIKGRPSKRKGCKLSEETKEKVRQANLGAKNPNYGKPRPQSFMDKMRKNYSGIVSPDGEVFTNIVGLNEFCRQHGLDSGGMSRLVGGKIKSYKGWTRMEIK